ncbi:hypothetical protein C8J57DRAFT_1532210 [Mycena rebaudengoi]|nr:hypothetical protein C8J57DRAFT_1532210 [Mycena rebaudengoi]
MCLNDCPCPRYIPQENPKPGPRLCRDCEHWESLHPPTESKSAVSEVIQRLRPQIAKIRGTEQVSDSEARRESSAGFRKDTEGLGRSGATKYKKAPGRKPKPSDLPESVGNVVLIPDAYIRNPKDKSDDDAKDVRGMGLATVPSVTRLQKLKDGGLVVSEDNSPVNLVFHKSWTVDEIDAWLASSFPRVWGHYEKTHLPPEDDKYLWIPPVARQGKLDEFEKKDAITGKDLVTCLAGKGKRAALATLYFALLQSSSKNKTAASTSLKDNMRPRSSRKAARKVVVSDDEGPEFIEVVSESEEDRSALGPSGSNQPQRPQKEVKLDPELATIAKTESLFFTDESDIEEKLKLASMAS